MPPKKPIVVKLNTLEDLEKPVSSSPIESQTEQSCIEPPVKPKRNMSESQLENLKKGNEIRLANNAKRKEENELKAQEQKRMLEAKLIEKAEALKKKQEKKLAVLNELSDDDDDVSIQKTKAKSKPKPVKVEKKVERKVKKVIVQESSDSEDYGDDAETDSEEEEIIYVAKKTPKTKKIVKAKKETIVEQPKTIIKFL